MNQEMLAKRRLMAGVIPYDSRIEYLESSGTQWINTLIQLQPEDKIVADMMPLTLKTGDNFYFGCQNENTSIGGMWCELYNPPANGRWYVRFCLTSSTSLDASQDTIGSRIFVELYRNTFKVNGTIIRSFTSTNTIQSTPVTIFGRFTYDGSTTNCCSVRFYGFQIYNEINNLRLDFHPVRVGQVGYMYDTVSRQLFGNNGTGDFVLGPDI